MSRIEQIEQFFEQVIDTEKTAQGLHDGIAALGWSREDIEPIQDIYSGYCAKYNIPLDHPLLADYYIATAEGKAKELTELHTAREAAKAEKLEQKRRAEIKITLERLVDSIETVPLEEITECTDELKSLITTAVKPRSKIITSKELMQTTFPPRQWIVKNLIGPGLTIISGEPKIGKSWLMFALAEAAATGGVFLDKYQVYKTDVFHLSLEDEARDIKERREVMARKQGGGSFSGNDNLFITTQWDTGITGLESYLRENPKIKLAIIDTLGQFIPEIDDINDYQGTLKPLAKIKRIAGTLDVAIVVVHHAKKGSSKEKGKTDWMEQSLGSQGIVGTADTIILMQRDIDKNTGERKNSGTFFATGRRIRDVFHKIKFSPSFGTWGIADMPEEIPGQQKTTTENDNRGGWT